VPLLGADSPEPYPSRYLPQVALATLAVVALPLAAVTAIQINGGLRSPVLYMVVAVALSVAVSTAGSAYWMRRPGSRDLVFGDLMLWGFIRRLRAEQRLARTSDLLKEAGEATDLDRDERIEALQLLASSHEARDPYTHGHTRRVTRHSEAIARGMGLSQEQVARVRTAAALHDVGKVLTPRAILTKPGALTDEEFEVVKRHPGDGAQMVDTLGDDELTAIVRHHHERLDGSGYPDGLSGEETPLGARIVAAADTFDAMTSSRPYRRARSHKAALDTLSREAGEKLDADAVSVFLAYYTGRRTVAWSALGIAAPQRLLTWVLEVGAAKAVSAVAAAALVTGSLGVPGGLAGPETDEGRGAQTATRAAGTSDGTSPGSSANGLGPGSVAGGARRAPDGGRLVVGPRSPAGPDSRTGSGGPGATSPTAPANGGSGQSAGEAGTSGGGGGSGPAVPGGAAPVPPSVSVPGTSTPEVEVQLPGGVGIEAPVIQLPGVQVDLPKSPVELPKSPVGLPVGPR